MDRTELTEQEREFFEKLHALCVEYGASIYGNGEGVETAGNYGMGDDYNVKSFTFSIGGREFHELYVNYRETDRRNQPALTCVSDDYMNLLIMLHKIE